MSSGTTPSSAKATSNSGPTYQPNNTPRPRGGSVLPTPASGTGNNPAPGSFPLRASVQGNGSVASNTGSISCPGNCATSLARGTTVTLTPTAATGYSFAGWSGDCSSSGPICSLTMNTAKQIAANFTQNLTTPSYSVSVAVIGNGSVTSNVGTIRCPSSCVTSLPAGSTLTLTAVPASGYAFSGWSGDCSGSSSSCSLVVSSDQSVTARIAQMSAGSVTVDADLWGLGISQVSAWPNQPFSGGVGRSPGVTWHVIEPTQDCGPDPNSTCYNWGGLDHYAQTAQSHGVPYLYSLDGIPAWAGSESGPGENPSLYNFQSLANFATALARRYNSSGAQWGCTAANPHCHGVINYYESLNEPRASVSVADLVRFSQTLYQSAKAVDPHALVGGPGFAVQVYPYNLTPGYSFSAWANQYYSSGGNQWADFAGWHAYACNAYHYCAPQYACDMTNNVMHCAAQPLLNQYDDFRTVMKDNGLGDKPILITEGGWSFDLSCNQYLSSCFQSLAHEPAYVARWYIILASASTDGTPGVKTAYWYSWDMNWGTLNGSYGQNPAASIAYGTIQKWLVGATFNSRCSVTNTLWICNLTVAGGNPAQIVFNDNNGATISYTAPSYATGYVNLNDVTTAIPASRTISVGNAPVMIE